MKKIITLIILFSSMSAFAESWYDAVNFYIASNRQKVNNGELKYGDYYQKILDLTESSSVNQSNPFDLQYKKFYTKGLKSLIPFAIQADTNKISKENFEKIRADFNEKSDAETERIKKVEKECKWEATSRAGNYTAIDGDITSNNPNKSIAAAIVSGMELGSRQNELMRLCVDAKL